MRERERERERESERESLGAVLARESDAENAVTVMIMKVMEVMLIMSDADNAVTASEHPVIDTADRVRGAGMSPRCRARCRARWRIRVR